MDNAITLREELEQRLEEVERMIPLAAASDADEHDDLEFERAELLDRIKDQSHGG